LRVENCNEVQATLRREISAQEKLRGILLNGNDNREPLVVALGKVTATQDIFGARIGALRAEAAAASSEKEAFPKKNNAVSAQAEELDIWLENNTEGHWKRVTSLTTVTTA
jgi:hypothetical protein